MSPVQFSSASVSTDHCISSTWVSNITSLPAPPHSRYRQQAARCTVTLSWRTLTRDMRGVVLLKQIWEYLNKKHAFCLVGRLANHLCKYVLSEGFQSFHSLIRLLKIKINILQSCVSVMSPFSAISERFEYIWSKTIVRLLLTSLLWFLRLGQTPQLFCLVVVQQVHCKKRIKLYVN